MSDAEALVTIALSTCTAVGLTFGRTRHLDHAYRHRWPRRQPAALASSDAYRESSIALPMVPGRAPTIVRRTSLLSTWLGVMFVPGLLAGLVGMAAGGVGLVSIPGLVIAARCWHSGGLLLAGAPEAAESARTTARWSTILNVIIAGLCAVAFLVMAFGKNSESSLLLFVGFTLAYALMSLAHAHLLKRSATLVEEALLESGAQQRGEPAPGAFQGAVVAA